MISIVLQRSLALWLVAILVTGCAAPVSSGEQPSENPQVQFVTQPPEQTEASQPQPPATQTAATLEVRTPSPAETEPGDINEVEERVRQVENGLVHLLEVQDAGVGPMDLTSRMAYYQVPGVSIAVINQGEIEWARGYGEARAGSGTAVTPESLFQAASMSKPVTAVGALALVEEGLLDLDADVNGSLASWKLPESSLTAEEKVTVRRLLSHTAGLTVHGFPGYPPGAALPSPVQILEGSPPSNSPAVQVSIPPGTRYEYSGGGYVLLQQLMMDASGESFSELMEEHVLSPLGMVNSAFSQPLSEAWASRAAWGHRFDGSPLEGGWRIYPEQAPAGLWSTPSDLARFLIAVDQADSSPILSKEMTQLMLTPVMEESGLGWVLPGGGAMFGHGGSNQGYRGLMFAVRGRGQGAVVMANSDTGMQLIFEIFRAIASVYHWPVAEGWRVAQRAEGRWVEVDPGVFASLEGTYQVQGLTVKIFSDQAQLWIQVPSGGPSYRLFPDGETGYFTSDGAQFIFEKDGSGAASALQMNGWGGMELTAQKVP